MYSIGGGRNGGTDEGAEPLCHGSSTGSVLEGLPFSSCLLCEARPDPHQCGRAAAAAVQGATGQARQRQTHCRAGREVCSAAGDITTREGAVRLDGPRGDKAGRCGSAATTPHCRAPTAFAAWPRSLKSRRGAPRSNAPYCCRGDRAGLAAATAGRGAARGRRVGTAGERTPPPPPPHCRSHRRIPTPPPS